MTNADQSLRDLVSKLVQEQLNFGSRELAPDDDLWNMGMTSLSCMGLMLNLEDALDVELPTESLQHGTFRSVNTIVAAVAAVREDAEPAADATTPVA
ncbi:MULTISPECIES: phosphopantetheine-binding protein [Catenuloplanes]|uniref:Acyl carrier protein n=1 Tax=Catenuloplanes niger TaxID=587534 RepID=A0AAE4CUY6_9ACTN|nr:phosphopantetheine-binding protein [Catenuloplanes niger]MDR7326816.1 acyl carrier protein [Catenuloplanes niger]